LAQESKNFGIAVVPDDSCVMLRYIWLFQGAGGASKGKRTINDSFTCGFEEHYKSYQDSLK